MELNRPMGARLQALTWPNLSNPVCVCCGMPLTPTFSAASRHWSHSGTSSHQYNARTIFLVCNGLAAMIVATSAAKGEQILKERSSPL